MQEADHTAIVALDHDERSAGREVRALRGGHCGKIPKELTTKDTKVHEGKPKSALAFLRSVPHRAPWCPLWLGLCGAVANGVADTGAGVVVEVVDAVSVARVLLDLMHDIVFVFAYDRPVAAEVAGVSAAE